MRSRRKGSWRAVAGAGVLAVSAGTACGQYALGDGRGLDRNLQVGSEGQANPRGRDFAAELRFRNAIVTGNAPNGLSFRGDLGYSDPTEFDGEGLGSDDLYAYRRDALYSGLSGMGLRGTDALQLQFALSTGTVVPDSVRGTLTVRRSGASVQTPALIAVDPDDPEADQRGTALWAMRSTSAFAASRSVEPNLLAVRTTSGGDVLGFMASGLRGVHVVTMGEGRVETTEPRAGAAPTNPAGPGAAEVSPVTDRLVNKVMVERIGQAAPAEGTPTWQEQVEALRSRLGAEAADPGEDESPDDADPAEAAPVEPSTVDLLRNTPGRFDTLVLPAEGSGPELAADDLYESHMRSAESLLADGRYFEAEERFTRALAARKADSAASIGRIHAQIGAGMYASASTNLRLLFIGHPELIGARYEGRAHLPADRSAFAASELRSRIAGGSPLAAGCGLLLAYGGFQTGDAVAVDEGLAAMEIAGQPDPLAELLGRVWRDAPEK